jgi:serine/threonine protein kinase
MITGIPPFYDSDPFELRNMIIKGVYLGQIPEFDKSASEPLRKLISKTLIVKSEDRHDADDLVVDPWINSAH